MPGESAYLLLGAGLGLANPLLTDIAMLAMPRSRAGGVASATVDTSRQFGAVLGVAVMGSLITAHGSHAGRSGSHAGRSGSHAAALLDPRPAYLTAAAAAVLSVIAAIWSTARRAQPTDERSTT